MTDSWRDRVNKLRRSGTIADKAFHEPEAELDLAELATGLRP